MSVHGPQQWSIERLKGWLHACGAQVGNHRGERGRTVAVQQPDAVETVVQRTKAAKPSHRAAVSFGICFAAQAEAMGVVVVVVEEGRSARALTHLATSDRAIAAGLAAHSAGSSQWEDGVASPVPAACWGSGVANSSRRAFGGGGGWDGVVVSWPRRAQASGREGRWERNRRRRHAEGEQQEGCAWRALCDQEGKILDVGCGGIVGIWRGGSRVGGRALVPIEGAEQQTGRVGGQRTAGGGCARQRSARERDWSR